MAKCGRQREHASGTLPSQELLSSPQHRHSARGTLHGEPRTKGLDNAQEPNRRAVAAAALTAEAQAPDRGRADGGSSSQTTPHDRLRAAPTSRARDADVGQIAKAATQSVVEVDATTTRRRTRRSRTAAAAAQPRRAPGFVYDTKGDIVTNEHVVDGASSVRVKFSDGSTYKATVVGSDTATDIAVLHIDAPSSKLVPLALADSSKVAVGDGVVAIGNPFGLDGTVTSGIVSAVGREISAPTTRRSRARSRPTPRSTTATPAARCSTCTAR